MLKQLSSVAVLVAALSAQQAEAGVSPPVVSGAYYEQNGTASCPPGAFGGASSSGASGDPATVSLCQMLFPAPPAGKQFGLDSVSCQLQVRTINGTSLKDVYIAQNVNGSISRNRFLDVGFHSQDSYYDYYTVDRVLSGSELIVAPVRIVTDVTVPTYVFMNCKITETLRNTPAP